MRKYGIRSNNMYNKMYISPCQNFFNSQPFLFKSCDNLLHNNLAWRFEGRTLAQIVFRTVPFEKLTSRSFGATVKPPTTVGSGF